HGPPGGSERGGGVMEYVGPGFGGSKGEEGEGADRHHCMGEPGRGQAPSETTQVSWGPGGSAVGGRRGGDGEGEGAAGPLVQVVGRVGRRPFWTPEEVRRWATGGGR